MKYYKILNEEECHNGLQYKTGLNEDILPFNPRGNCEPGGIYFAREDILVFLEYGPWIREVLLPEDVLVYEESDNFNKWKASKVILGKRRRINDEVIRELIEEGAIVHSRVVLFIQTPEMLRYILARINKGASYCIAEYLIQRDRIELFVEFIKSVKISEYMLELAVYHNAHETAKCLIANGIKPNFTARAFAREPNCSPVLSILILENK